MMRIIFVNYAKSFGKKLYFSSRNMALFAASLNSGSNGNCYYIGNDREAILVDAGISCRETERRMQRLGLSISNVKAIIISHEHNDHIKGVEALAKKYNLPIFITSNTYRNGSLTIADSLLNAFTAYQPFPIGEFTVTAFPKFHDAADPHSFVITCRNIHVGVFTDIGSPCNHVIENFKRCHAVFLEANYDEEMLQAGSYPYFLKMRIRGGFGHLSNKQALELFIRHKPKYLSHLFLSHLSKDNNCPQLAQELFMHHAGGTEIIVASRYEETAVYQIGGEVEICEKATKKSKPVNLQYNLFEI